MTDGYRPDDENRPRFLIVDLFDGLGPRKFIVWMIGIAAYAGIDIWLDDKVGWPDNYGFQCLSKGCLFEEAWHSPALLHHHTPYEIALFIWIWLLPILFLGVVTYFGIRKLRSANPSLYSNDTE